MKIDTNAFMNSLPIMGVGLLGIFIVTIVIIVGIYILKAITPNDKETKKSEKEDNEDKVDTKEEKTAAKKESALDLMREREKKDFLKEEECNYISHDL
jgi:flagellar biosynthesis/type III secretory pathway M-ring protein FliF/YscJ